MKIRFLLFFRPWRSEAGSVSVEFAFVGAILLIATLGAFELGRIVWTYHNLETAVGVTTRLVQMQASKDALEAAIRSRFSASEQTYVKVDVAPSFVIDDVSYTRIEARYELSLLIPGFSLFSGSPYIVRALQLVPTN